MLFGRTINVSCLENIGRNTAQVICDFEHTYSEHRTELTQLLLSKSRSSPSPNIRATVGAHYRLRHVGSIFWRYIDKEETERSITKSHSLTAGIPLSFW